ncbi:hypothetical protein ACXYUI_32845, partial [Klebsiella pneumoniae]
ASIGILALKHGFDLGEKIYQLDYRRRNSEYPALPENRAYHFTKEFANSVGGIASIVSYISPSEFGLLFGYVTKLGSG